MGLIDANLDKNRNHLSQFVWIKHRGITNNIATVS